MSGVVRHVALIPAAGSGTRFGAGAPKQYTDLAGQPMLRHAIARLARHPRIDRVVVVLSPDDVRFADLDLSDLRPIVDARHCGGDTRAASVLAGLRSLVGEVAADDWILVHDAARPCLMVGLALSPFRRIVKDYFMICESYYQAIRTATPSQIETIDMARRGLHNEGSELLLERLNGKVEVDFDTARRLFTLVCVLHWRG